MTSSVKTEHAPPAASPPLAHELWDTIRLAAPMALTQLSQIAMMSTDLAFIGRLGGDAVAAAALAGTVYFVGSTFGMGLM
ncbi:MAG: MATE family efflux transporter, partial [Bradyrhizobium sp.]